MNKTVVLVSVWGLVLLAGGASSQSKRPAKGGRQMGCLPGCTCGGATYSVLTCQKLPQRVLPIGISTLQVKSCPAELTRSATSVLKPASIKTLDLSDSGIERIADNALAIFVKLEIVRLSKNHIKSIQPDTFKLCNNVKEIYLDGNGIEELGHGCFKSLNTLQVLDLQNNNIKTMPSLPPNVQTLDVSKNQITDLTDVPFQENIENLNLCLNPLKSIPPESLAQAKKIKSLCTSTNPEEMQQPTEELIKVLPSVDNLTMEAQEPGTELTAGDISQITGLPQLTHLSLVGYNITTPQFLNEMPLQQLTLNQVQLAPNQEKPFLEAMTNKVELEELDLSASPQLANILVQDNAVWSHMAKLEHLKLQDTQLTNLGEAQRPGLNVDLSKNPLNCDCKLVKKFINEMLLGGSLRDTVCASPEDLKGMTLSAAVTNLQDQCKTETNSIGVKGPSKPIPSDKLKIEFPNNERGNFKAAEDVPTDEEPDEGFENPNSINSNVDDPFAEGTNDADEVPPNREEGFEENGDGGAQEQPDNQGDQFGQGTKEGEQFGQGGATAEKNKGVINLGKEEDEHIEKSSKTTYIVVGVILALAVVCSVIFTALFFYCRRRGGHDGIEESGRSVRYEKQASSHDNLVKGLKK